MRYSLAASALVLVATSVYAQGETRTLEPSASAPTGCDRNYAGSFEITVIPIDGTSSATVAKRSAMQPNSDITPLGNAVKRKSAMCMSSGTLVANLNNGVLTDSQGRTGSIVANRQFQFDGPAQAGAIYTGGFAVCSPSQHLALGDSAVFYQCSSGSFFNIYDEAIDKLCQPVYIEVIPCDGSVMGMNGMASDQIADGQIQNGAGQIADGQIQNGAGQIADGQIQVPSINQIADGQVQNRPSANQIADGQVQNRPSANQIADGQVQISGSVSQIADGQLQNTGTAQGVQQIADGQIQARQVTDPAAPISETEGSLFTNAAAPKKVGRALGPAAVAAAVYAVVI